MTEDVVNKAIDIKKDISIIECYLKTRKKHENIQCVIMEILNVWRLYENEFEEILINKKDLLKKQLEEL